MPLEWDLIGNQVGNCYLHPVLELWVLNHLLFNETDCLGRNIETEVIEARVFPEKGEQRVADSTAQLHKFAYFLSSFVQVFVDSYGLDLSL